MKAMIVDDERLALVQLEKILRETMDDLDVAAFQDVGEALELARREQPDVVFLDIHMPEISGLQAAEMLQGISPDADIVFVTAYDEYAVQAFELNAIDYLLKPFTKQRVEKTLQRVAARQASRPASSSAAPDIWNRQTIHCFKTIRFQHAGGSAEIPKWRTAKAQELFAFLLHRRGEMVHKSAILEMMSPELDRKRAMTQLYTVIYQVRQCLQQMGMSITINNASIQEGYILQTGDAAIDTEQWERKLIPARDRLEQDYEELESLLLDQYAGDYLGDHDYTWAEEERERLRQLWLHHARLLGDFLRGREMWNEALRLYERIQRMDPYQENECMLMLQLYDRVGQFDKVVYYYERLQVTFGEELELSLPNELEDWFNNWKQRA